LNNIKTTVDENESKVLGIKKIALVSCYLDDGDYGTILNDSFIEEFVCNEDHFYHRIAKSLSLQGLEPVVIYPSIIKQTKTFQHKYGHSIIRIPAKKIPFFHEPIVYSPELVKKIKEFDICHFVSGYYIMYKVPDLFDYCVSKIHNKIPIITRWAGGNSKWLFPIRKAIKKNALQKCDRIICSGKDETNILETKFEIPKNKIKFLMNPIDLSIFQKREKIEICKKLNHDPKFNYILYVGRLVENKGIENILNAFKKILSEHNDVKLIFIGSGPLELKIKEFIEINQLHDSILFKGQMTHNEICYYYNIASILINATVNSGGLPNVIIEAIASGVPVIATDFGAARDFVNEKKHTGILIKNYDSKSIELAISKILNNEFSSNFDHKLLEKFSFIEFGKELIKIYEKEKARF
jgi:glycosyltransferase involved in cell wall biosynthesis